MAQAISSSQNINASWVFQNEMLNLKQDNERLQRIVTSKSLTTSQCSLAMEGLERRFSMTDATNSNIGKDKKI